MRIHFLGHYWHLPVLLLWLTESVAALVAYQIASHVVLGWSVDYVDSSVQSVVFGTFTILALIATGLFSRRLRDRTTDIVLRITVSVVAGAAVSKSILAASGDYGMPVTELAIAMVVAWLLLAVTRLVARGVIDEELFKRRVLVYGAGNSAARILQLRRRSDQRGFRLTGFVPAILESIAVPPDRLLRVNGSLRQHADAAQIDEIVVAMDDRRQQFPLRELLECRLAGIEITELVTFLERETGKVYLDILSPSWMIFGGGFRRDIIRRFSERVFDLLASLGLLLFAAPVMLLVAAAIKLEDGLRATVLYGQARVGFAGKKFTVLKFRSMRVDAEGDGQAQWAVTNDQRVTRVGAVIRKARIDELPQLLNVLRGEMSFVGPRPERPEFVDELAESIPYYLERHSVKPGITGWAQLCYPYGASEKDAIEKLQYDLYYVKHHSLLFDILILLQTVEVVLFGKGAR